MTVKEFLESQTEFSARSIAAVRDETHLSIVEIINEIEAAPGVFDSYVGEQSGKLYLRLR